MNELSTQVLTASLAALRDRIETKRAELAIVTEELRRGERELQLIIELIRIRGEDVEPTSPGDALSIPEPSEVGPEGQELRLAEAVVQVLRRHGKAMHIQELTAAVRSAGIPIPGRGESANLIAHIRSHPEVVRPVRGIYGLREWGIEDAVPRPRRRRRAARRRGVVTTAARGVESRTRGMPRTRGGGK